jgi:D-glycero-alpha-D-manno-heptose 1-phosphate guanylyltransferase
MEITTAILAGGRGTRLQPVLHDLPKVLAPVGDRPFIMFLLDQLADTGIGNVVLLTGYRAEHVRRTLGTRHAGTTLSYSVEPAPLGTAGALRHAWPGLKTDTLLVMNGDSFCEADLLGLLTEHRRCRAEMTLTVAHVPDVSRFGQVRIASDRTVTTFLEKQEGAGPGWINAGVYVLERSMLEEIPRGQCCSLEHDMLPGWARAGRVRAFRSTGRFLDIGTPGSYAEAVQFFHAADLVGDSHATA